jgi:acyl-CoA thioesterase-1
MMINIKIASLPRGRANQTLINWCLSLLLLMAGTVAQAANDKLLIVGDSLSAAYGIPVEQGWVAKLSERIDGTRYMVEVVNASVSGDTTANGLTKLPALLSEYQPAVVIIELGGNDGLRGLSIKKMKQNLTEMTELATTAGAQVILTGMQIPSNYGAAYTKMFTKTYTDVASQTDALLVPFLLQGLESGLEWFQSDGVHPNANAQPIMLDNVWEVLEPVLEAKY